MKYTDAVHTNTRWGHFSVLTEKPNDPSTETDSTESAVLVAATLLSQQLHCPLQKRRKCVDFIRHQCRKFFSYHVSLGTSVLQKHNLQQIETDKQCACVCVCVFWSLDIKLLTLETLTLKTCSVQYDKTPSAMASRSYIQTNITMFKIGIKLPHNAQMPGLPQWHCSKLIHANQNNNTRTFTNSGTAQHCQEMLITQLSFPLSKNQMNNYWQFYAPSG